MNNQSVNDSRKRAPRLRSVALILSLAASLATSLGCGPSQPVDEDRTIVSGTVTFKGKPLKAGTITFQSTEKALSAASSISSDGHYKTNRAPLGHSLVTIGTESVKFGAPSMYVKIPEKYSDPYKSGLEVDIKEGKNENADFQLK